MTTELLPDPHTEQSHHDHDPDTQDTSKGVPADPKAAHYEQILDLNVRVQVARQQWEEAKGEASYKRKQFDMLADRLSELIAAGPDWQRRLFADDADEDLSDSWREVRIEEALALTPKQIERLDEAGITTIGQLEDLRAGAGLTSIGGIGQGTADKIED